MSCNTFIPIMDLVREVEALLAANYIDKDDPRITSGVFTNPTIKEGFLLDVQAREEFCRLVQECGLDAPFGKMWLSRPLYPDQMFVSYEDSGEPQTKWRTIQAVLESAGVFGPEATSLSSRLAAEIDRATAAESGIISRAEAADDDIAANKTNIAANATAISAENTRAVAAEGVLTSAVDALELKDLSLQSQVNSIGGGKKAYTTYALMVADKDNIDPNSSIDVTTDTDPLKNGTYSYDGAVFTKSIYDPLAQAKSYTDAAKTEAISTAADDATTKANTAKTEAIADAALDATAKANAVKSYTDSAISALDFGTPVMTGQAIYDKSLTTPEKFTAIWSEYNKPVWHIGGSVFVDAVGATVKVVEQEFVMTYKLTEENQTVRAPLISKDGSTAYVDWGDGTANYIDRTNNIHSYTNTVGQEFVITITGELEVFNIGASIEGNRTADCIKSIDKNTMPKTTTSFTFRNFPNLVSLCDGAFSSLAGDSLNLELYQYVPKTVTYSNNLFAGLQNVKNIDNLFAAAGTDITGITYSPELFKYFTSVTSAKSLFARNEGNITKEHLAAMTELQYAYRMFASVDGVIDSDVLTNQTKLIDVNQCFYSAKSPTTSVLPIYQHLLNNNPNLTNYVECFKFTNMQDIESVPVEWK